MGFIIDCNAATRNVPPWFVWGRGVGNTGCRLSGCLLPIVGNTAADCRDACCRSGGCLERVVLMPCTI